MLFIAKRNLSVCVLLFIIVCWTTPSNADLHAQCILKQTCTSCIKNLGCIWCDVLLDSESVKLNKTLHRCISEKHQTKEWCPSSNVVNFKTGIIDVLEDKELNAGTDGTDAIQIKPQHMKLRIRNGDQIKIPLYYQQARDYPIDLYFLMDLSNSMADDKDKLSAVGDKVALVMKNITNNFRVGFGSFVDKPDLPFVNTVPSKFESPCIVSTTKERCVSPYSFKNTMPLTSDTASFSKEVKNAPVSGNVDFPEGGFDGLMQVMVCKDHVGWRSKARKLIVFCTDAAFHMAGDGKLAGIVEPNDEACHLDDKGYYTHSLNTDYPSLGQLDKQARENNINIIFAVVKNQAATYKAVKETIYGAVSAVLSKDSSNIVDLVKDEYEKLVDSVILTDTTTSSGSIKIDYFSKCIGTEEQEIRECKDLRKRPKLEFTAVIKAVNCPNDKKLWKQTIEIKPSSLTETLKLDIEIMCQCPCEQPGNSGFEAKSPTCKSHGDLQCGICNCAAGRYGQFCECDDSKTNPGNTSICIMEGSSEVCSGNGFCKCGVCDCVKRESPTEVIYGTYCECDNFSCKRHGNLLCSGPEKGSCECGECKCQSGWSGPACECRVNNATCMAPDSTEVCSDRGTCVCGVCQCAVVNNTRYSGKYCKDCPHCTSHICKELRDCVECQIHSTGKYNKDECSIKCTGHKIEGVEKLEPLKDAEGDNQEGLCKVPDDGGCTIIFKYKYDKDKVLEVKAEKTKECTSQNDLIAIICGVVGGILAGGIVLLLVWKISTTMHDRREYEKFEKEKKMAKFDRGDNPLYKPSTSTFKNPIFKGTS